MLQPPVKKVRVVERFADDADAVVAAVCSPGWAGRARVIKDTEKVSVLLGEAAGREVVVKTVRGRVFGSTKLRRDCRAWYHLLRAGVSVPRYYARVRGDGVESLIMERVPGHSLLWEVANEHLSVSDEHRLARAVADLVFQFIVASMYNVDFKPSNVLVSREADHFKLAMIDLDGFKAHRQSRIHDIAIGAHMLAKQWIECEGCGIQPRLAVRARAIRSFCKKYEERYSNNLWENFLNEQVRNAWQHATSIVDRHGDPTPKDDPLEFDRRMMGID